MGPGQARLLIWSVPTVAVLLSLVWYKRKGGKKVKPKEVIEPPEEKIQTEELVQEIKLPTTPQRSPYSRSLSGVESSPIDIKSNRSPPLVISDQELDMEIEKIKSMKSTNVVSSSSTSPIHVQDTSTSEANEGKKKFNNNWKNCFILLKLYISESKRYFFYQKLLKCCVY